MRCLALVCWLGAAAWLVRSPAIADLTTAEPDRILHLLNDQFISGPLGGDVAVEEKPDRFGPSLESR